MSVITSLLRRWPVCIPLLPRSAGQEVRLERCLAILQTNLIDAFSVETQLHREEGSRGCARMFAGIEQACTMNETEVGLKSLRASSNLGDRSNLSTVHDFPSS